MRSTLRLIFIFLILSLLFTAAVGVLPVHAREGSVPATYTEKTGQVAPYPEIVRYVRDICRIDRRFSLSELGKTTVHKSPIYMVKVEDTASSEVPKLKILFIGTTHGCEPAGGEALLRFMGKIAENRDERSDELLRNATLYIIPCLNPEGVTRALEVSRETGGFWSRDGRTNAQGIDINRDYLALNTNEAVIAVSLFNRIRPDVVLDLHEYSTVPLVVAGDGWWRGVYFDFLVGAGRHPDVYPPLSQLARKIVESYLFPGLKAQGLRGEYYMLSGGDFSSFSYIGASAASYFNIRNALTILFESPGYDQGERTFEKRVSVHLLSLDLVLPAIIRHRDEIRRSISEAREYSRNLHELTLGMKTKPRMMTLGNRTSDSFNLTESITIDGRRYASPARVRFTQADPGRRTTSALPRYYLVLTADKSFLSKLLLHRIAVFQAVRPVSVKGKIIPEGAFFIPTSQESALIIGMLFDEKFLRRNRFTPRAQYLSFPMDDMPDVKDFLSIKNEKEIGEAVERFMNSMVRSVDSGFEAELPGNSLEVRSSDVDI